MAFIKRLMACIGICLLLSCTTSPPVKNITTQRFEFSHHQMGTLFTIILYAKDSIQATSAANAAFQRIDELNQILSDYQEDSELSHLSATAGTGKIVRVSNDLWKVLNKSINIAKETQGAFDITVGPYVQLWRRVRRQQEFPSTEALDRARQSVGYSFIQLYPSKQSVELTRPGMKLDAGGLGKGYAVDEAMKILKQQGMQCALINGGGNILVSKAPPGKKGWQVGIAMPESANPSAEKIITLTHSAVATSGDVYQYVELDGKRYSHILDPRTGIGLTNQVMVTVLAKDGITADLLSTAVSVLGHDKGLQLVEKSKKAAAVFSSKENSGIQSWNSRRMKKIVQK